MKFLLILLISTFFMTANLPAQMEEDFNLVDYRWKNRVLLIFSPNSIYTDLTQTMQMAEDNREGFTERDLKAFQVLGNIGNASGDKVLKRDDADTLRERFEIDKTEFSVILIGKDGTEKLRTDEAITKEILFETIDDMPMRKLEMKEDG